MSLLVHPHKTLSTPTTNVESVQEALELEKALRTSIVKDCTWGKCVGLASNQIGLKKSAFIARGKFYANPRITWYSGDKHKFTEGCYSLKGRQFTVERSGSVMLSWLDNKLKPHFKRFDGFSAQVIQHEMDHLLGFTIKERQDELLATTTK